MNSNGQSGITYLTLDWQKAQFRRLDFNELDVIPEKPKCFSKMINFSKELSKGIPFVRVDWFEIGGKLYFAELTFYPSAGYTPIEPEEWDIKIGGMLKLPSRHK